MEQIRQRQSGNGRVYVPGELIAAEAQASRPSPLAVAALMVIGALAFAWLVARARRAS